MTRSFIALAIIAAFLGASWGGAFIGGIVYGEYRSDGGQPQAAPRAPGGGQFAQADRSGDGAGGPARSAAQSRQAGSGGGRTEGGGTSNGVFTRQDGRTGGPSAQPAPGQDRGPGSDAGVDAQSSADKAGGPPTRPGAGRGGVLMGTIKDVAEGNVVIETESATKSGTVSAALSDETVILTVREAGVDDLSEGVQVVVLGRGAGEGLTARALLLNTDGVDVSFLGGTPSGGREDRGLPQP